MSQSIHGHDIMRLIQASDPPLSREALGREVTQRYGEAVSFEACCGGGMSLDQLLEFLTKRGKVVEVDGTLRTNIGLMCSHGE